MIKNFRCKFKDGCYLSGFADKFRKRKGSSHDNWTHKRTYTQSERGQDERRLSVFVWDERPASMSCSQPPLWLADSVMRAGLYWAWAEVGYISFVGHKNWLPHTQTLPFAPASARSGNWIKRWILLRSCESRRGHACRVYLLLWTASLHYILWTKPTLAVFSK